MSPTLNPCFFFSPLPDTSSLRSSLKLSLVYCHIWTHTCNIYHITHMRPQAFWATGIPPYLSHYSHFYTHSHCKFTPSNLPRLSSSFAIFVSKRDSLRNMYIHIFLQSQSSLIQWFCSVLDYTHNTQHIIPNLFIIYVCVYTYTYIYAYMYVCMYIYHTHIYNG